MKNIWLDGVRRAIKLWEMSNSVVCATKYDNWCAIGTGIQNTGPINYCIFWPRCRRATQSMYFLVRISVEIHSMQQFLNFVMATEWTTGWNDVLFSVKISEFDPRIHRWKKDVERRPSSDRSIAVYRIDTAFVCTTNSTGLRSIWSLAVAVPRIAESSVHWCFFYMHIDDGFVRSVHGALDTHSVSVVFHFIHYTPNAVSGSARHTNSAHSVYSVLLCALLCRTQYTLCLCLHRHEHRPELYIAARCRSSFHTQAHRHTHI